ncbi:MAG: hypothetical protein ABSD80_06225 [Caulobacteraceae bacterium]|jgi:hypothetical protein
MTMFQNLHRTLRGPDQTLKLACEACGHSAILRREDAVATYGPDADPFRIRRASRCGVCGERADIQVWI